MTNDWDTLETELGKVAERISATFPNVDRPWHMLPTLLLPWGNGDGGLMVDYGETDATGEHGALRIGIYSDLSDEHVGMVYVDSATDAAEVIDFLTTCQPEGTDWSAWAGHWAREIWPDGWAR